MDVVVILSGNSGIAECICRAEHDQIWSTVSDSVYCGLIAPKGHHMLLPFRCVVVYS